MTASLAVEMKEIGIEKRKAKLTEEMHKVQASNALGIEGQARNDGGFSFTTL